MMKLMLVLMPMMSANYNSTLMLQPGFDGSTGVDTPDDASDDTSGVGEVTTLEDTDHVFDHSEFNFYDPDDPTSDLTSITITGLPSTGKIFIDGLS